MKQSSKRIASVFFSFVFILAAFILFFDLVQPTYTDAKSLESQQLGEQTYLKNQTTLVSQVQATLNAYQNEAQTAANVGLAMPSGEDVAGALAQVQGIAANNNITMTSISVTPPQLQIQTTAAGSASSTLTKPLGSFSFNLSALGSYENFKSFLSELETNIRIFDVKTISIQPTAVATSANGKQIASSDLFSYSITVATYYQTQ